MNSYYVVDLPGVSMTRKPGSLSAASSKPFTLALLLHSVIANWGILVAPICWVMPPASPSCTLVRLILSRIFVFPEKYRPVTTYIIDQGDNIDDWGLWNRDDSFHPLTIKPSPRTRYPNMSFGNLTWEEKFWLPFWLKWKCVFCASRPKHCKISNQVDPPVSTCPSTHTTAHRGSETSLLASASFLRLSILALISSLV